ncbi:DUF6084 family protein, partial [Streptomyces sp. NPDC057927]
MAGLRRRRRGPRRPRHLLRTRRATRPPRTRGGPGVTEFAFTCTGVRADRFAAGPTLVFRLRITATGDEPVHAMALR